MLNAKELKGSTKCSCYDWYVIVAAIGGDAVSCNIAPRESRPTLTQGGTRKEKAPGPCELRALLRDEPSSPRTRHGRRRITGHRQTLRSDNASYARALDRAHNLSRLRDEIGIASDHFKGG